MGDKEIHYIIKDDPDIEGSYSREELIKLVEKMESEGWTLWWPTREDLGSIEQGTNWSKEWDETPPTNTVAIMVRDKPEDED
jgi:hypothetical protein